MSRPATANKIVNWDAFAHAAHVCQLGSCTCFHSSLKIFPSLSSCTCAVCNYYMYVHCTLYIYMYMYMYTRSLVLLPLLRLMRRRKRNWTTQTSLYLRQGALLTCCMCAGIGCVDAWTWHPRSKVYTCLILSLPLSFLPPSHPYPGSQ